MISFSNQISRMPVSAMDGEIGHVADLLCDAQKWRLLYLHVATGWLFGRDVLVPVQKLKLIEVPCGPVEIALTRSEVEHSPALDASGALDEVYEKQLLAFYGIGEAAPVPSRPTWLAPLRASEITGYKLDAAGEIAGTVQDIVFDLDNWRIRSFIADIRGGFLAHDTAEIGIGPVTGLDRGRRILHLATSKEALGRLSRPSDDELPYVFPELPPA
jgi:hypothetical protein